MDKNAMEFLVRAKQAIFAGNGTKIESSYPNSKDWQYTENELKYLDTYLGGANFAGEEAL